MKQLLKRLLRGPEEVRVARKPRSVARIVRCKYCDRAAALELWGWDYQLPPGWRMIWVGLRPTFVCKGCNDRRIAEIMKTLKGEKI